MFYFNLNNTNIFLNVCIYRQVSPLIDKSMKKIGDQIAIKEKQFCWIYWNVEFRLEEWRRSCLGMKFERVA